MRAIVYAGLPVVLMLGCAANTLHGLQSAPGTLYTSKERDISECMETAEKAVQLRVPLTSQERDRLKGRPTNPFLKNNYPVVDRDGNPVSFRSVSTSQTSSDYSDRYVLCLLSRGYRWDDDETTR